MKYKIAYTQWIVFPLSLIAWAGVGLFAWTISRDEANRIAQVQITQDAERKEAMAVRLHSIIQDTATERAQLASVLGVDVVSVIDMIEAAGKAAGVKIAISNAQPENVSFPQVVGGPQIIATGFVVEAQGTFKALMHTAELLETLPVPATIGHLDLELKSSDGKEALYPWSMNTRIRVLTTSDIGT